MTKEMVQAELEEVLTGYAHQRDERERAVVMRNGYVPKRETLTGVG